jgi:hypothetical protein
MIDAKVIKTLTTDIETKEEYLSFIKCSILVNPNLSNIKTFGLTVYPDYTDSTKVTEFEYLKYSVVAKLISIDEVNPRYRLYIDVAFYTEADLEDSGYFSELQFTALIMYKNMKGSYELRKI